MRVKCLDQAHNTRNQSVVTWWYFWPCADFDPGTSRTESQRSYQLSHVASKIPRRWIIRRFHLVYVYSCHRGVTNPGWKHVMTFTSSTKYYTVHHSPIPIVRHSNFPLNHVVDLYFVRWNGILKLPFQPKISSKFLEKHESIKKNEHKS